MRVCESPARDGLFGPVDGRLAGRPTLFAEWIGIKRWLAKLSGLLDQAGNKLELLSPRWQGASGERYLNSSAPLQLKQNAVSVKQLSPVVPLQGSLSLLRSQTLSIGHNQIKSNQAVSSLASHWLVQHQQPPISILALAKDVGRRRRILWEKSGRLEKLVSGIM